MTTPSRLSDKQERFCREYVANGHNATAAATAASYANARQAGSRLLSNAVIRARIDELEAPIIAKLDISAEAVLREIALVAFARLGNVIHVTADGDPYLDFSKMGEAELAALSSAEIEDFVDRRERDGEGNPVARDVRRVKGKMNDKVRALELLGRHQKLFTDKVEVTVEGDFAASLLAARKRAKGAK